MSRDPSDKNANIPPWLRDQPLPPRPSEDVADVAASAQPVWPPSPAAPETSEDIPDWLRSSTQNSAPAENDPLPDWLRESADTQNSAASNAEPLPDWLRESGSTQPTAPTSSELPEWLRDSAENDETSAPAEEAAENMPDWLRGLAEETSPSSTVEQPNETVPEWLLAMAEEPSEADPDSAPDWLSEGQPLSSEAADTTFVAPSVEQPIDETGAEQAVLEPSSGNQDVESWLNEISLDRVQAAMSEEETPPDAIPFSLEGVGSPDGRSPETREGPPAWLGDDSAETSSNWFDAPTPASPPADELSDSDAPDWLNSVSTESPAETRDWQRQASAENRTPNETPSWLQDSADIPLQQDIGGEQPVQPTSAGDQDVPTWLRETSAEAPAEEVPAWLRTDQQDASGQVNTPDWVDAAEPSLEQPATTTPAGDVPDWLRDTTASAPQADDQNLPKWLRDEQTASPAAAVPASSNEELPPWLRDESESPLPNADQPGEQALPPWLKGAANEPAPSVPAQPTLPPAEPAPLGNWFDEAVSGEPSVEEPADSEFFGTTDLPAWLRPQEQPVAATNTADSRALDWLNRIGGTEDENAVPVAATARFSPPPSPVKTEEQNRAIALLAQLAQMPETAAAQPAIEPTRSAWRRTGYEWLLYLLLLLALLLGPFVPSLTAPLQVPPTDPSAQTLFNQIGGLGPQDVVLIGYDWDARRVAELRPLETAVIDQLVAQKVKLVLMSTDPQGSLLLYDLRERLNAAGYQPGGQDYILLGYQPGGEFALRAMAQNFGQLLTSDFQSVDMSTSPLAIGASTGTNTRLESLSNFSMIMLLADDQTDVQSWMEQVNRAVPNVPFATLLTAEAAPAAEPYLVQPNVFSLSGTTGAFAYTALRGGDTNGVAAQSGLLRLGMVTFVMLLLLGMIVAGIGGAVRRRNA